MERGEHLWTSFRKPRTCYGSLYIVENVNVQARTCGTRIGLNSLVKFTFLSTFVERIFWGWVTPPTTSQSLNGKDTNDLMDDGGNSEDEGGSPQNDLEDVGGGSGNEKEGDSEEYFALPTGVTNSRIFKGITKSKTRGEVEVTLKLPST